MADCLDFDDGGLSVPFYGSIQQGVFGPSFAVEFGLHSYGESTISIYYFVPPALLKALSWKEPCFAFAFLVNEDVWLPLGLGFPKF